MLNRQKQADVLRRTQATRKEQKKERVLKAIEEIQKHLLPLTFKNIAKLAGCSVSYLYKWDDIKAYIHDLQKNKETTLNSLEEPEGKYQPNSLKTLHQIAKDKICQLQEEISELKRQNELVKGHVAEIYEIRDENERLQMQLRELTNTNASNKVVAIQATMKEKKATYSPGVTSDNALESVIDSIKAMGIKVNYKLREAIGLRDIEKVKLSIEAYKQYSDSHEVKSQEACLLSMICDAALPNTESKPVIAEPQHKNINSVDKPQKELISLDKLKQLSSLFRQNND